MNAVDDISLIVLVIGFVVVAKKKAPQQQRYSPDLEADFLLKEEVHFLMTASHLAGSSNLRTKNGLPI